MRQPAQVIAGGGRKEMDDPVHQLETARRRPGGIEAEQGDHPVHVDHQQRPIHIFYVSEIGRLCPGGSGSKLSPL
jgi:hypothetical protein